MKKLIYLVPLLFILGCKQEITISGSVSDNNDFDSIHKISINQKNETTKGILSNKYGKFEYNAQPKGWFGTGDITLVFEKEGYLTAEKTFNRTTKNDDVEIKLEKDLSIYKVRQNILDTVKLIETDKYNIGYSPENHEAIDKARNRRSWFRKNATIEELLELRKYPNSNVLITVFKALYRQGNENAPSFLIDLSERDEIIYQQNGCFRHRYPLAEYCLRHIMSYDFPSKTFAPPPPLPSSFKRPIELTDEVKSIVIANIKKRLEEF